MDLFSTTPPEAIAHSVELYTRRFLIQGTIHGPFKRTTDMMNRREPAFLLVRDASITPIGQTEPKKRSTPIMVRRSQVQFASIIPQDTGTSALSQSMAGGPREYAVKKVPHPCYALTDVFVVHGFCHLLEGSKLDNLLEAPDMFIPLTGATIYLVARPATSWKRDLVIVNKEYIEVMYLAEA